ncbi:MAG: D-tyrosyl-tRNA(Tyr) deacylase [Planctomycetes bacterium]|nr:D-tyrosyl-tRNA(Tyr) deacylase [Planctomycetota bacterium]
MRIVLQRVRAASVAIAGELVGAIDQGLLVLVGIADGDDDEDLAWMVGKLVRLRVFPDDAGQMNLSVIDVGGGILAISQFTLFASTAKGNRPSYLAAARPEVAEPAYLRFVEGLTAALGRPIATGRFAADMQVSLINDGPVTLVIDSKRRE